ncbi:MAG TPA: hypothetical protein VLH35_02460 [Candidatus Acidoferrales bacterium]|nr:hypothetical protein [Candidatus Acidoferrales bacterium]
MKKSLTFLLIILTVSSITLTAIPQASSATTDIKILDNYICYTDTLGYLVVIGEVQNTGSSVIKNIAIGGSVTEADGTQGTSATYAWADYLLPGQKAPFYLEFTPQGSSSDPWDGVTASDVTLRVTTAPVATQYQYQGITITSQRDTPTASGEYWVTADLKNSGSVTATDVMVVATFYNSEGKPVAAGYMEPVDISAGASKTVKVPAFDLNQSIVSSDKVIRSWSLLVQVASPMQTDGNYPTFSVSPTTGGSNSGANNNGTSTPAETDLTVIYAAAGIAAIAIVVAAVFMIKRRKTVAVKEKPAKPTKHQKRKP